MCLVHNCTQDVAVQILSKRILSYRQRLVLFLFHTKLNNFHQQHLLFINDLLQCTTFEEVMGSLRYWKQRWRPQNMLESMVYFKGSGRAVHQSPHPLGEVVFVEEFAAIDLTVKESVET